MTKETETREHHDKMPPSSMPALDKCSCFKPGKAEGEYVTRGNKLHDLFGDMLAKREEKRWQ